MINVRMTAVATAFRAHSVRSVGLFQASYHRGHPALMELHGELGRRHLTFWSSAQAISQQKRALQSIVFDAVELTDY